jgi:nucleoside-diphosphate-sugar epimerase
VVAALLERGNRVAVLARNTANLPPLFLDQRVGVVRGDVTNNDDLRKAMEGVSAVVNLAHAGGADSWPEVERRIVGGARRVAELCLEKGVKQLVHASTIAALYLGDGGETITGETQPDPNADRRAVYSRAKALAERELMRMRDEQGLPVTILRPGVVIGDGTSPFHSGIGLYNRDSIASAGMPGTNELPLVLAEDVATAIAACLEQPVAIGRCYNVVGDVRLSARDYTQELARATGRSLAYHPQSLAKQQANELMNGWSSG